jgi:cysteine-rich repeat protein
LAVVAACQAVVPGAQIDPRLAERVTGPWVASTEEGPLYLFLVDREGEVLGGLAHSLPGTAVAYLWGRRDGDTLELLSHPVAVLPARCDKDGDCCSELPFAGRAFCYCDAGSCTVRGVCLGDSGACGEAAGAAVSGSLRARVQSADPAVLRFEGLAITYRLGPGLVQEQQPATLEFHRLAEYYDRYFGGAAPGSADANPDLDCEPNDRAPTDPDADGDGMPDGCVDLAVSLGLVPAGAGDLLSDYHCGNHHLEAGELCDDWLAEGGDEPCLACHSRRCGDGVRQDPEQCDDGNDVDDDDCSNDCHLTASCGDGYVHRRGTPPFEQCDEGPSSAPGSGDFTGHCLPGCILARCGDGFVDRTSEECDLGNGLDDGGDCTRACKLAVCGDGLRHQRTTGLAGAGPLEQCDDQNLDDHDSCLSTCVLARCGDGIVNCPPRPGDPESCQAEVCDDGNTVSGDGCNASCSLVDSEDFPCNHITPLDQVAPAVGVQPGGAFVIAWEDKSEFGPDVSAQAVRARLFAADGGPRENPITGDVYEFPVNTTTARAQRAPALAVSPADGRFVIVYEDESERGACATGGLPYTAVRARLFAADGSPLPVAGQTEDWEILPSVGSGTTRHPPADLTAPRVAFTSDGSRFLVVWEHALVPCPVADGYADVRARFFDADGTALAADFQVNTTDTDPLGRPANQDQPDVAFFADGSFVVAWSDASSQPPDSSGRAVRARLFSGAADGTPRVNGTTGNSDDFVAATLVLGDQTDPRVATGPDGFVVGWTDGSLQNGGQVCSPPCGTGTLCWSGVCLPNRDDRTLAVRARLFSSAGVPRPSPLGSHPSCPGASPDPCCTTGTCDFQVNTTTDGLQQMSGLAAAPDGSFLVTFVDQSQEGADTSTAATRARAFFADGSPHPTAYGSSQPPPSSPTGDFVINTRTQYSQLSPAPSARADGSAVVAFADNSALGPDFFPWGIRARILFLVLGGPP